MEMFDPRNVHVKYSYHDNDPRNTYALVTAVKSYPSLGSTTPEFKSQASYDYDLAKPLTATDINSNTTAFAYTNSSGTAEPLVRLVSVTRPDGSLTRFTFADTPSAVKVSTATAGSQTAISKSKPQLRTTAWDGPSKPKTRTATALPQPMTRAIGCPP